MCCHGVKRAEARASTHTCLQQSKVVCLVQGFTSEWGSNWGGEERGGRRGGGEEGGEKREGESGQGRGGRNLSYLAAVQLP